ncbi:uncharacterized protein BDR25DRAFT_351583 [Lindgomyces ingoldianus]|uniref:Uncharacterized protein n=1 Tax=Lindgomyces ingoldianus TaxID=673940 RepID=A0ACB6R6G5_9PLEO|nr:uncharacterized protein BDR25DRAFT_351583 [Lindgomyces ingoldianus]KAF2474051.1 hypothetical protein BDR25DRAFT_351583 [Lindgomyces ingoldianus]
MSESSWVETCNFHGLIENVLSVGGSRQEIRLFTPICRVVERTAIEMEFIYWGCSRISESRRRYTSEEGGGIGGILEKCQHVTAVTDALVASYCLFKWCPLRQSGIPDGAVRLSIGLHLGWLCLRLHLHNDSCTGIALGLNNDILSTGKFCSCLQESQAQGRVGSIRSGPLLFGVTKDSLKRCLLAAGVAGYCGILVLDNFAWLLFYSHFDLFVFWSALKAAPSLSAIDWLAISLFD